MGIIFLFFMGFLSKSKLFSDFLQDFKGLLGTELSILGLDQRKTAFWGVFSKSGGPTNDAYEDPPLALSQKGLVKAYGDQRLWVFSTVTTSWDPSN